MSFGIAVYQEAALRHATYYLSLLDTARVLLRELRPDGRHQFDNWWPQIDHSYHFLADHWDTDPDAAALCLRYVVTGFPVLMSWRTVSEVEAWQQTGLAIAQQTGALVAEIDIFIQLAQVYIITASVEESRNAANQALQLARQCGYAVGEANALLQLGRFCVPERQLAEARTHLQAAAAIFAELDEAERHGWTLHNLGTVAQLERDYEEAEHLLRQAIAEFETVNAQRYLSAALSRLGEVLELRGDPVRGLEYAQQALQIGYASGDTLLTVSSLLRVGVISVAVADFQLSRQAMAEAAELSRQGRLHDYLAVALQNLAWYAHEDGDYPAMQANLEESLALFEELGFVAKQAVTVATLAFPLVMQGKFDAARQALRQGWALGEELHDDGARSQLVFQTALYCAKTNDVANAVLLYGVAHAHFKAYYYPEEFDLFNSVLAPLTSPESLAEATARAASMSAQQIVTLLGALLDEDD